MANDKDWQRRSDEWVKAMEESRVRKENLLTKASRCKKQQDKILSKPSVKPKKND